MANREHLDLLKQNVAMWHWWRQRHPEIQPDLSFANLYRAIISAYPYEADLSFANLYEATLSAANLGRANAPPAASTNGLLLFFVGHPVAPLCRMAW